MLMRVARLILFFSILAVAIQTQAQTSSGVGETRTNVGSVPKPGQNNTNQAAGDGKGSQMLSMGMNVASAGMLFAACYSSFKTQAYLCAMGAMALGQAALSGKAAGKSGQTYNASLSGLEGMGVGDYAGFDPYNPKFDDPQAQAGFSEFKENGFTLNKDGSVTTPNGTFKPEDFSSTENMMKAGLTASQASGLSATMAKINAEITKKFGNPDQPNVVAMGFDSAGGGGGRGPASEYDSDANFDDYLKKLRNPFGVSAKDRQNMLAGKSRTVGDDAIGVKVDDIFKMVHRRYQEKRAADDFIEVPVMPGNIKSK